MRATIYSMPTTQIHVHNPKKVGSRNYLHFTDEETEAQWGKVTCPNHTEIK